MAVALALVVAGCQGSPAVVAGARVTAPEVEASLVTSNSGCRDHRSAVDAVLPGPGAATVGGVALPPGRVVDGGAVWVTDAPVPGSASVWAALEASYPSTGLWPVLLAGSPEWGAVAAPDEVPPPAVALARAWERTLPAGAEWDETVRDLVWPFHRAPVGIGPGVDTCAGPLVDTVSVAHDLRLALVAVARPADVVSRLSWPADGAGTTALLRSWETRFGAFVVAVGDDTVHLGVERPPPRVDDAYRLAAELFAVDPTLVTAELESIGALAAELPNRRVWSLSP